MSNASGALIGVPVNDVAQQIRYREYKILLQSKRFLSGDSLGKFREIIRHR
jgi:hypothetical protein